MKDLVTYYLRRAMLKKALKEAFPSYKKEKRKINNYGKRCPRCQTQK